MALICMFPTIVAFRHSNIKTAMKCSSTHAFGSKCCYTCGLPVKTHRKTVHDVFKLGANQSSVQFFFA